jgi:hypothetical protein
LSKYLKEEEKELLMSQKGRNCKKNILFSNCGKTFCFVVWEKIPQPKKMSFFVSLGFFLSRFGAKATY